MNRYEVYDASDEESAVKFLEAEDGEHAATSYCREIFDGFSLKKVDVNRRIADYFGYSNELYVAVVDSERHWISVLRV